MTVPHMRKAAYLGRFTGGGRIKASQSSLRLDLCVIEAARPVLLFCAGSWHECLADYNIILQLEPKNIDAVYHRGTVYEKLGRLDEAIQDFTSVLQLDPNHIKASYSRGACRNLKGEFSQAIGESATPWQQCRSLGVITALLINTAAYLPRSAVCSSLKSTLMVDTNLPSTLPSFSSFVARRKRLSRLPCRRLHLCARTGQAAAHCARQLDRPCAHVPPELAPRVLHGLLGQQHGQHDAGQGEREPR